MLGNFNIKILITTLFGGFFYALYEIGSIYIKTKYYANL